MKKEKETIWGRIIFVIPASMLLYVLYLLIDFFLAFLFNILLESHIIVSETVSCFLVGMLLLKLHEKTEGKLIGYLEGSFLIWIVLNLTTILKQEILLKKIYWAQIGKYQMFLFLIVLLLTSYMFIKVKYKQSKLRDVMTVITLLLFTYSVYWFATMPLHIAFSMDIQFAAIILCVPLTIFFLIIEYISKRRNKWKLFIYYLGMSCIGGILLYFYKIPELTNKYGFVGEGTYLDYLFNEMEGYVVAHSVFGIAIIFGVLLSKMIFMCKEK